MAQPIVQPVLALVLLTFAVWVYMYLRRIRYILSHRIAPQRIATPELINSVLPEHINRPSNNLKNLFELPVIFYVVCILSVVLQYDDRWLTMLAWIYVGLRTLHSVIQCTANVVTLRFASYFASSLVLWVMAAKLAFHTL